MFKRILLLLCIAFNVQVVSAKETLHIYAASSMTNAVNALVEAYQQQHDVKLVTVYGGSSSLARQIEAGAPADLFISANEEWANYLVEKSLVKPQNVTTLAANRLVLIRPSTQPIEAFDVQNVSAWQAALADSRLAVAQVDAVPAGIYAKQALQHAGVWSQLESRLAQTNNVRLALALVERGESPLGIVYKTDAMLSDKVTIVTTFSAQSHQAIRYPLAQLNDKAASAELVAYFRSAQAQQILQGFGFESASE
ncbi:molybdate ABC transporter substrate-binding protein [Vibrio mimicus]|uniref:molybdate ABC transporter substrate-binding protein n=1 Tax=Vibrio mimicus TaxID=674 RepID=UPI002F94D751